MTRQPNETPNMTSTVATRSGAKATLPAVRKDSGKEDSWRSCVSVVL